MIEYILSCLPNIIKLGSPGWGISTSDDCVTLDSGVDGYIAEGLGCNDRIDQKRCNR